MTWEQLMQTHSKEHNRFYAAREMDWLNHGKENANEYNAKWGQRYKQLVKKHFTEAEQFITNEKNMNNLNKIIHENIERDRDPEAYIKKQFNENKPDYNPEIEYLKKATA